MPVVSHSKLPFHEVPRIKTRVLASEKEGAEETSIWEQWIEPNGHIPLHYHETEEVLIILEGDISLTIEGKTSQVAAPATVIVPVRQVHGLRPTGASPVHLLAIFPSAVPKIFSPDGILRPLPWEDFEVSEKPP